MTWTLTELAALAARALADAQVPVANGRVRGVPDGRLIRWYTTIGLLDRPALGPDRFARYGPRHLLQLVAVKRLQAQGLPIAEIQARLAGATDSQLNRVADLPTGLIPAGPIPNGSAGGPASEPATGQPRRGGPGPAQRAPSAGSFWTRRPPATTAPAGEAEVSAAPAVGDDTVTTLYGLRIGGLTLLLPAEPAPHDLDAIAAAARPLLDLLAARDLDRERAGRDGMTEGAPS